MKKIGDITNTADKNGEFTDGNVAAGTPPTQLMAAWFNSVQREILNVLAKAGVPQSATKEDQLAEAITKLVASAGYLPTGYSYSKVESDNKYATNAALNNGLDKKLDKTGGTVTGKLTVTQGGDAIHIKPNSEGGHSYFQIDEFNGTRASFIGFGGSSTDKTLTVRNDKLKTSFQIVENAVQVNGAKVMLVGDYGLGTPIQLSADSNLGKVTAQGCYMQAYAARATKDKEYPDNGAAGTLIVYATANNYSLQEFRIFNNASRIYYRYVLSNGSSVNTPWIFQYNTGTTVVDRNGCIKSASYPDGISDYPVGSPIPWPQATAPAGYLICNGQWFNKTNYPLLAKAYPSGQLPDLRSEFIRGLDAGRNVDSGRTVLSAQGDAMQNMTGSFAIGGAKGESEAPAAVTGVFNKTTTIGKINNASSSNDGTIPLIKFDASNQVRTANENRPRNIAFLYIVRAA